MDAKARQKFNAMLTGMAELYGGNFNGTDKFSVDPVAPELEQTLEKRIQEKGKILPLINIRGVRDLQGEKLGLGSGSRVASRTDTTQNDRKTKYIGDLTGRKYQLYKTDFDTHISYSTIDEWSAYPEFETMYRDLVTEQIAIDRETIGWNGISAAADTDLEANPNLEDLNRGWIQGTKEDKPSNILGSEANKIKIGEGGTYKTLDSALFDMRHSLLDPWHRGRSDLIAILGEELYNTYNLQMLEDNLGALERNQREQWLARGTIGGIKALGPDDVPFFPIRGVLITTWKNLSIYYQRDRRRRTIVDNAKRDQIEDYQSINEGYVVEDYGLICGIDSAHLLLPDGNGGWA